MPFAFAKATPTTMRWIPNNTMLAANRERQASASSAVPSLKQQRSRAWLRKRARKGVRDYPVATVAFYGPDNRRASKVAVAIIQGADEEPSVLERWYSDTEDLRSDYPTTEKIVEFLKAHGTVNVAMADAIIGCPHEEGIDYPEGESCPECPYWRGRDRWSGLRKQ